MIFGEDILSPAAPGQEKHEQSKYKAAHVDGCLEQNPDKHNFT